MTRSATDRACELIEQHDPLFVAEGSWACACGVWYRALQSLALAHCAKCLQAALVTQGETP